jgi:hypothetical protein
MYRLLDKIRHVRVPAAGLSREIVLIPESGLREFLSRHEHGPEAA